MLHRFSTFKTSIYCMLLVLAAAVVGSGQENETAPQNQKTSGSIVGQITAAGSGTPLIAANILLVNKFGGTTSDKTGTYEIKKLSRGTYSLRVSYVGFESKQIDAISVVSGEPVTVNVALVEKPATLKGITVTPGRFTIMGEDAASRQALTRREIETLPQLGDDLYRAVQRLPGMASDDFSTKFRVRGGEYDEVLATLDGLQLYEPFHLKDIKGGAMSIVDVSSVEGIDLMTGGFTAEFGDRMSGVFNIRSKQPAPDHHRLSLSASFLNTRLTSEGTFSDNKGSWLASARRGYIDLVLKIMGEGEEIRPTYYDFFGKLQYKLGNKHVFSTSVLHAGDYLKMFEDEENSADSIEASWRNSYAWMTLHSELHPRLLTRTIASVGRVTHDRWAQGLWGNARYLDSRANDKQEFTVLGLKTDVEWEVSDGQLFKFGGEVQSLDAEYDYFNEIWDYTSRWTPDSTYYVVNAIDSTIVNIGPSGEKFGAYLSSRTRLAGPLTAEVGLRYDHSSYSGDDNVSPRVNLVYDFAKRTSLKLGWGFFYQTQRIDEISVGDGDTQFYPAERAEHKVVGFEHGFESGLHFRVEAYYKKYTDLRPEYRNTRILMSPFPEVEYDRVLVYRNEATSKGLELYLKESSGGSINWWLSYSYAKMVDDVSTIFFGYDTTATVINHELPNPADQRHTLYFDVSYTPNASWQFNLAAQIHTGALYTDFTIRTVQANGRAYWYWQSGELWGSRHGAFSRVDLRMNKYFNVSKGRFTLYAEILNVLNKKNVRDYDLHIRRTPTDYELVAEAEHWFGLMPSLGVAYTYEF